LLVAVGLLGVSLSAPVTTATAAPALAIAFWRSALGALATAPYPLLRRPGELWRMSARSWRTCLLAGVMLAVHFSLWLPSLRMTTVTAATALVATTPVWTVAVERLSGRPVPALVVLGVAVAMAGILVITGVDAGRSGRAVLGDLLALGGGMAAAGYVLAGERAQRDMSAAAYAVLAYGACALLMVPVCLLGGVPLAGFGARTWAEILLITLSAQLIGHSTLNAALPVLGATPVALALLFEVPGASLVAWAWLRQQPPVGVVAGTLLVLAGLVLVLRGRSVADLTRCDPPDLPPAG
jgi:drug/metabolite transporter (DMT)-like permease